jgi:signal transduction histidine kinase
MQTDQTDNLTNEHTAAHETRQSAGQSGVRKYHLTLVFLVVSALIFTGVAVAINITTARSEEQQIVSLTTTESVKDAKRVAGIVTELLDSSSGGSVVSAAQVTDPGSSADITKFLADADIVGLNIYRPDGATAWSSSMELPELTSEQREIFVSSLGGSIATGLIKNFSVARSGGAVYAADVVETYVPISDAETGATALVLGVTRDVTTALSTSISQSRSAALQSTLLSLGIGFVVLLITVFIADVRLWKQRELAIGFERASAATDLSVAKLNLANRELQQISDERERILATVSHELKTPLTSIIAFTDILARNQSGEMKERNVEQLSIVKRSSDHLLSLINDLLSFNRMTPVDTGVSSEEFEIKDLLDELQATMNPLLAAKRQELAISAPEEGLKLRMDRRRILQALMNLVSNSSKFSNEGSIVLTEVRERDHTLQIMVADPGEGMTEEVRESLLGRKSASTPYEPVVSGKGGSGLGFAITRDIVEAHGGKISIRSGPGQGTRVLIEIPTLNE